MGSRSTSATLPHADAADRRLLAYALATGAVAVPAADGAIVYTAVTETVPWSATGNSVQLNIDGTGLNDLQIGWSSDGGDRLILQGINGSRVHTSTADAFQARYFAFGSSIGDGDPTIGGSDKVLARYSSATPYGWTSGTWSSGGSGYAGFQLGSDNGQLGWLHVTVPASAGPGSVLTVHGYAYETVAEQSITAGAVPAPGALLTLALGAAGIRGRRARAA